MRRGVRLHTDGFVQVPLAEISHAAGPAEEPVAAIHMVLQGEIQGDILLALPEAVALSMVDMLIDAPPGTTKIFDDFARSCLQETGNIVGTSFANALAQWLSVTVVPASPVFVHDLACAVIEPLLFQEATASDATWLAKTEFELDTQRLDWSLMLLLSADSLQRIRGCCHRDEVRRSALHFVGVNAAFQASRTISKWLKKGVRISTQGFAKVPLKEAHLQFDSDDAVVILHMSLLNQMSGHLMLVMSQATAVSLSNRLLSRAGGETTVLDEMARSCLQETANIMATSFTNGIAKWLEIDTQPTSPEFQIDLPQAAFESILAEQAAVGDEALISKTLFRLDGETLECAFYVLPTPMSYRLIEVFCG